MLRGKLVGAGNWLIIASVLPTVLLAVALVFDNSCCVPVWWALVTIALQAIFLLAMWRGPLSAPPGQRHPPTRVLRTSPQPRYGTLGVLHADWWQTTTAYALVAERRTDALLFWDQNRRADGVQSGRASLRNGKPKPGNHRGNGSVAAALPEASSLTGLLRRLQSARAARSAGEPSAAARGRRFHPQHPGDAAGRHRRRGADLRRRERSAGS
jgi:hypothetical protein